MKAAVFLLLATASTVFAGVYYPETPLSAGMRRRPKVVGGEEAVPHSIPYQVALFLNDNFCGGSLITKKFVLTAAHCGVITKSPVVILGAHKIDEKEDEQVSLKGKKVIVHRNYSGESLDNDIALIELPQEAPINEYIKTVTLICPFAGSLENMKASVSGWGRAYSDSNGISPVLRVTHSHILSNDECEKEFDFGVPKTVICLDGKKLKGACNGDSGGPLFIRAENQSVQIGIVSFGSSAGCERGYPTGYSRITSFIPWIVQNSDYKSGHPNLIAA